MTDHYYLIAVLYDYYRSLSYSDLLLLLCKPEEKTETCFATDAIQDQARTMADEMRC